MATRQRRRRRRHHQKLGTSFNFAYRKPASLDRSVARLPSRCGVDVIRIPRSLRKTRLVVWLTVWTFACSSLAARPPACLSPCLSSSIGRPFDDDDDDLIVTSFDPLHIRSVEPPRRGYNGRRDRQHWLVGWLAGWREDDVKSKINLSILKPCVPPSPHCLAHSFVRSLAD